MIYWLELKLRNKVLPLTIAHSAHLQSQFNHVFAVQIFMPQKKAIVYTKIDLNLSYYSIAK